MSTTTTQGVCPIDGGNATPKEQVHPYLVCESCHEMLTEGELVRTATVETRVAYARANGHSDDYR